MGKKQKNSVVFVDTDLLEFVKRFNKKVEDFSGKGGAFDRTIDRVVPMMKTEYQKVIASFKNPTGQTEKSLMDEAEKKWVNENKLNFKYGFKISKGGLASLFINYGRPGIKYKNGTVSKPMKPTYFLDDIFKKFENEFKEIFKEEVLKELGGLTE